MRGFLEAEGADAGLIKVMSRLTLLMLDAAHHRASGHADRYEHIPEWAEVSKVGAKL